MSRPKGGWRWGLPSRFWIEIRGNDGAGIRAGEGRRGAQGFGEGGDDAAAHPGLPAMPRCMERTAILFGTVAPGLDARRAGGDAAQIGPAATSFVSLPPAAIRSS